MKIRLVGAEFFHEDGQTDRHELIIAFNNFAKAHKKSHYVTRFCVRLCVRAYVIYHSLALPLVPFGKDCVLICE